jgi:hypothetical protein
MEWNGDNPDLEPRATPLGISFVKYLWYTCTKPFLVAHRTIRTSRGISYTPAQCAHGVSKASPVLHQAAIS